MGLVHVMSSCEGECASPYWLRPAVMGLLGGKCSGTTDLGVRGLLHVISACDDGSASLGVIWPCWAPLWGEGVLLHILYHAGACWGDGCTTLGVSWAYWVLLGVKGSSRSFRMLSPTTCCGEAITSLGIK